MRLFSFVLEHDSGGVSGTLNKDTRRKKIIFAMCVSFVHTVVGNATIATLFSTSHYGALSNSQRVTFELGNWKRFVACSFSERPFFSGFQHHSGITCEVANATISELKRDEIFCVNNCMFMYYTYIVNCLAYNIIWYISISAC